jgi:ATP-binding cassette subfamily B protein
MTDVAPGEDPDLPNRASPQHREALRLAVRYYFRMIWRHRRVSIWGLLLPALGDICQRYLPPLVVARIAVRLADGERVDAHLLGPYVLAFGGCLLVGEVFWRIGVHALNRLDGRGIRDLYLLGMDELLAKDAAFFHDNFAGSLTKRVLGFASKFEEFGDTLAHHVVANLVPLLFAFVILWRYDWRLVAVLAGMLTAAAFLIWPLIRRRQFLVDRREAARARVSGGVADTLANMDAVRAFGAEEHESRQHGRRVRETYGLTIRSWDYANLRIDTVVGPVSIITNTLGLILALSVGKGRFDVETIVVTFTYYTNATRVLFEFNQTYRHLESCTTEAAQFTELLLAPPTVTDAPAPLVLAPKDTSIRFDRVSFSYAADTPLFRALDLVVGSGERVGLVGRSGGGKTTITRLLLRLMDIDDGRILIGGQDIASLRQSDLRQLIAYVPQDPAMFHRSLYDNIAFGRPSASAADVRAAADAAHVTEFADALPEGFDTLVGERGVKLSGGQRQRVAIARAILRDAPILLLDEATSALDSESEAHIQRALWDLMAGRTALVVAHRLSTVARMDRLVVLDAGAVVEQGTHDELLALDGRYADLWRRQSGGFLAESTAMGAGVRR